MGEQLNYDNFAEKYAQTRWADSWIVAPLLREVERLPANSTIVEIGCGTGNYIIAISEEIPCHVYKGFDLSDGMLRVARARSTRIEFSQGNAALRFPYPDGCCDLAFAVNVIHHIESTDVFLRESARILKPGGRLLIVTDSEENIRSRSLTRYFPETLEIELRRYPQLPVLHRHAEGVGLQLLGEEAAEGSIDLDASFISKLEQKCSSAMRLISPETHRRGIKRVQRASERGEQWFSCYTVIKYEIFPTTNAT